MNWKSRIHKTANSISKKFANDPEVVGVAIGGSVGKNMVWKHSDLELCIVVEKYIERYGYFNFIDGMGVEIIQIMKEDVEEYIRENDENNMLTLKFPIQIYRCKVIYDPENIVGKFKDIYDSSLFSEQIVDKKMNEALETVDKCIKLAKGNLAKGNIYTVTGLCRMGINDMLLANYWKYHILPRSQNRTVYLLKKNSEKIGSYDLYNAFVEIFNFKGRSMADMKERFFEAKEEIYNVTKAWGEGARNFLDKAVDGQLEWGYPKSILYVHKWCVHILHLKDMEERAIYDQKDFLENNTKLYRFLDFDLVTKEKAKGYYDKLLTIREEIED